MSLIKKCYIILFNLTLQHRIWDFFLDFAKFESLKKLNFNKSIENSTKKSVCGFTKKKD